MTNEYRRAGNYNRSVVQTTTSRAFGLLTNWIRELLFTSVESLPLSVQELRKRCTASSSFQAMNRLLFAGLLVFSVSSFTTHASSSRPHIIFILADDLVNMILTSFYLRIN